MKNLITSFLLLAIPLLASADGIESSTSETTWTDSNGMTWSFKVSGAEATDIKAAMFDKTYIYGDPNNPTQGPVTLGLADAAAGRFSSNEGRYFPTLSDDVYFGYKTLIFEITETTKGQHLWGEGSDMCTMRVMDGWWNSVFADNVPMSVGLWELPITEAIAHDCAQSGLARDLDLLMTAGTITIKSVYYQTISLPEPVVVIPEKVYAGSTELTVTSIGDGAFEGCSKLTSVTIPENVTSIGDKAFFNCSNLTSVTISSSVKSIGDKAFKNCSTLMNMNIPEGVTSIGDNAFQSCYSLTNVTIPSSVTSIGNYAFEGCRGLTSVTIPEGVTSIGDWVFHYCMELTNVTIPEGVTSIGNYAFSECRGLTSITIPESVTSIGNGAFEFCTNLTNLTISEGVSSIGDGAFADCIYMTSVSISSSVTSIGDKAFSYCFNLASISIESGNPVYDSRSNCNAIIETATNKLITGCKNTIIPEDVTSISENAFAYSSGLTNVTIPESVTSIGDHAFYNCPELTSVAIPSSVTSIGDYAFHCPSLTSVTSLIKDPFEIGSHVFVFTDWTGTGQEEFTIATLYVPAGTKEKYLATEGWNQFQNIVEMDIAPVEEGQTIDIGNEIDENTNLEGTVVDNVFVNISNGDGGFDHVEGCLIVSKPTDDSAINGKDIFGDDFKDNYTGIVFKVNEGKGSIKVEAETLGNMVLKVKIGNNDPIEMELDGKLTVKFPYNVSEETLVYIYGGMSDSAGAKAMGATRASSDSDLLKIYGIEVESDVNGIGHMTLTDVNSDAPMYNLNGQRVNTPRRSVYIRNGKKVLMK